MRKAMLACAALVAALVLVPAASQPREDPGPVAVAMKQEAGGRAPDEPLATDVYDDYADLFGADRSYFPIGVWFESIISKHDVTLDKQARLNLYVVLTDDSDLSLVRAAGMRSVPTLSVPGVGPETIGWFLDDEIDMIYGPGEGYEVMQQRNDELPDDGRSRWANYGKGVLFWETDEEAATFVNDFQDVVSTDAYWYTDRNICAATEGGTLIGGGGDLSAAQCHRAANYGRTVDRVQSLVDPPGSSRCWPSWSSVIRPPRGTGPRSPLPRPGQRCGAASSTAPRASSTSTTASAAPASPSTSCATLATRGCGR